MSFNQTKHIREQRAAQAYVIASEAGEVADTAHRCRECRHFAAVFRPRCNHGDFPVTKNATCARWVAP